MTARHHGTGRLVLTLASMALVGASWLAEPLAVTPLEAAPAAQTQPSPAPRQSPTPRVTRTPEQELQDLQRAKLQAETGLLREQRDRLSQEQEIDKQAWRAPAAALSMVGPTLVGLGLLYLLARALSRLLPPERARPAAPPEEDEEDEEL